MSVPARRFPLAVVDGLAVLRAATRDADVLVIDSLASNTLGPWLAAGRGGHLPMVGGIHQVLGGVDRGRWRHALRSRSDRMAWTAFDRLAVASEWLADQLVADGLSRGSMTVVPPQEATCSR